MQHSSIAQDGKLWNKAWSDNVGHKNQYHAGLYNFLHNIGVLTTKSWWLEVKRRSKFQYATAWPHHPISTKLATGISHLLLRQHACCVFAASSVLGWNCFPCASYCGRDHKDAQKLHSRLESWKASYFKVHMNLQKSTGYHWWLLLVSEAILARSLSGRAGVTRNVQLTSGSTGGIPK